MHEDYRISSLLDASHDAVVRALSAAVVHLKLKRPLPYRAPFDLGSTARGSDRMGIDYVARAADSLGLVIASVTIHFSTNRENGFKARARDTALKYVAEVALEAGRATAAARQAAYAFELTTIVDGHAIDALKAPSSSGNSIRAGGVDIAVTRRGLETAGDALDAAESINTVGIIRAMHVADGTGDSEFSHGLYADYESIVGSCLETADLALEEAYARMPQSETVATETAALWVISETARTARQSALTVFESAFVIALRAIVTAALALDVLSESTARAATHNATAFIQMASTIRDAVDIAEQAAIETLHAANAAFEGFTQGILQRRFVDEIPFSDNSVYISAEGLERMKKELEELRNIRRPEVAAMIQRAKELGDITDSAQYDAAKNEQAFLEGRIRQLEDNVRRAVIIEYQSDDQVRVGSTVMVVDNDGKEERCTIVGRAEADVAHGRISNESPVGRVLIGKKTGDTFEIDIPGGKLSYTISAIE